MRWDNKFRKYSTKGDANNNVNAHQKDVKPTETAKSVFQTEKKSLPFQYDHFSGNTKTRSHNAMNHPNRSGCETNSGHQNHNGSSRFLQFFAGCPSKDNSNEKLEKSGSSASLNEFFKQAMNSQNKTDPLHLLMPQHQNVVTPNSRPTANVNFAEMPSVDELEAKWRQNSSNGKNNEYSFNDTNNNNVSRDSENFKKLIGQLNSCSTTSAALSKGVQQNKQQSSNLFNNENLSNFIFKTQQLHQQPPKQTTGATTTPNHMQSAYNKQNAFLRQQEAALIANLQLKAILSRPEAQMLLLGLAKGMFKTY